MKEFSAKQVALHDPFWSPRQEVNAQRAIFHQLEQLEASRCIDNFRIAAGEMEGFREGWFFADSDAYKWLDAAARIYATHPSPRLATLMDNFIALLGRAQSPDGYLFTYNQIHFPGTRWVNLQIEHELYCHGHLIEAGVSHYEATGITSLLEIARRAADLLVKDFLGADPQRTPGHEEVEIALLRLYRASGHTPSLNLARHFLEQRGRTAWFAFKLLRQIANSAKRGKWVRQKRQEYIASHPERVSFQLPPGNYAKKPPVMTLRWYASGLSGKYFQQHTPIRNQTIPVGHAVRFGYLKAASAMLHRLSPDTSLLPALEQSWERMVTRRMYVTGGVGSLAGLEGFGNDYELDPEYAYAETCAALASLFWNWEMALITQQARYSDLFEWQLYNAAAVGMGLSGENYLYNNPLTCRGGVTRQAWYAVPCCPSNLSRTWADLARYIYSTEDAGLWVHQYIGSQAKIDLGMPVDIDMESELPWNGRVRLKVNPVSPAELAIHLRFPSWCMGDQGKGISSPALKLSVNGEPMDVPPLQPQPVATAEGYDPRSSQFFTIRRTWRSGDIIELRFDMPIVLRRAHPKVKNHQSKAALTRGPLIYCLESVDNPDLDIFTAQINPSTLRPGYAADLLGGIWALYGQTTTAQPVIAIPYHLWANRGESQMTVWVNVAA